MNVIKGALLFSLSFSLMYSSTDILDVKQAIKLANQGTTAINDEGIELGYGIDAIKDLIETPGSIKTTHSIFDENFIITKKQEAIKTNIQHTDIQSYYTSSYEDAFEYLTIGSSFSNEISLGLDLFNIGNQLYFDSNDSFSYSEYQYHNYLSYFYYYENYALALPEYLSNKNLYIENLSQGYLEDLEDLFTNKNYTSFFSKYGTHVICKGIYGAKLNLNYVLLSNKRNSTHSTLRNIRNDFNTAIDDAINAKTKLTFSYMDNEFQGYEKEKFTLNCNGGSNYQGFSFGTFGEDMDRWTSSLMEYSILVNVSSDGLIPLFDLLPTQYVSKKSEFKDMYESYYQSQKSSLDDKYKTEKLVGSYYYEKFGNNSERTVTDLDNVYDVVTFQGFPSTLQELKQSKYKYMNVILNFRLREENDGYQDISIKPYLDMEEMEDNKYDTCTIEHGAGRLATNKGSGRIVFKSFLLEEFFSDSQELILYIRYGAHGNGSDNWLLSDVSIEVEFSQGINNSETFGYSSVE